MHPTTWDADTRKDCLTFLFIPLRERASAPSGHLLPGEGGRMPPPASSFRAKARNLFRSRSAKRGGDDGSRETPCTLRRGMPIRERTVSHSFSSRLGSEPPLLRGTSFQGKEGVCRLPHRHSRLLTASFLWMSQAGIIAASVPTTVIKGMIRSPRGSGAVSITTAA